MKKSAKTFLSRILAAVLIGSVLLSSGVFARAESTVTVFADFEDGTEGMTDYLVNSDATWCLEKSAPLSGNASLQLKSVGGAGCYVNFPAQIGVCSIAFRIKTVGTTGIVRVGANGNDAHNKRSQGASGYEEFTTAKSEFICVDTEGNIVKDIVSYDGPWGGWRFSAEFDGYVFIKNTSGVNISKMNIAIFHGSTNADGFTLTVDDFSTFTGDDYAAMAAQMKYNASLAPVTMLQNFEQGSSDFSALMTNLDATWKMDSARPLSLTTSLAMTAKNGAGSYVTFPAAAGKVDLGLRIKTTGSGVVRIVANGTQAQDKRSAAVTDGYEELTASAFTFLDKNGQTAAGASYDGAAGGLRFTTDFDGYLILKNENRVDITKINVGIVTGSTDAAGFTLQTDNYFAANTTRTSRIYNRLCELDDAAAMALLADFEDDTLPVTAYLENGNARYSFDVQNPLSEKQSLKIKSSNGAGSAVRFAAAAGKDDLGLRIQVNDSQGVLCIGANGSSASDYTALTTASFTFLDLTGAEVAAAAVYDGTAGGLRFNSAFDGYLIVKNENAVDIGTVLVGIISGTTAAADFAVTVDNVFAAKGMNYDRMVARFKAAQPTASVLLEQRFEDGMDGISTDTTASAASCYIEEKQPLCGRSSLVLQTNDGAGVTATVPLSAGRRNIGMRLKLTGTTGTVRIGVNGADALTTGENAMTVLTDSDYTFYDLSGNVKTGVAAFDPTSNGLIFNQDFDGYLVIGNPDAVKVTALNIGIAADTATADCTLAVDNLFTCFADVSISDILEGVAEESAAATEGLLENFEGGNGDITSYLVNGNAQWTTNGSTALCGAHSLKLSTNYGAGCYVNFPANAGRFNIAMRIKVEGSSAVIRIGANGSDAHQRSKDALTGYYELTEEDVALYDTKGNEVTGGIKYDAAWGGFRFTSEFDGYICIKNTNRIDINKINVGIFHGSATQPYAVYIDEVTSYRTHSAAALKKLIATMRKTNNAQKEAFDCQVSGISESTKDAFISDTFDAVNAEHWSGSYTVKDSVATIGAAGITSVYGQKATAQKPVYAGVTLNTAAADAGIGLVKGESFVKFYYSGTAWRYAWKNGAATADELLAETDYYAGDQIGILYSGTHVGFYLNNSLLGEADLPQTWDATVQYNIRLYGACTTDEVYVAGGVYTGMATVSGMSDDFDGAAFDADKWETIPFGYVMNLDDAIGHPGTLTAQNVEGRLEISGEPDANGQWAGVSVITAETQSPSVDCPVTFEVDRVSVNFKENNPTAMASGIGIYADNANYFQFAINSHASDKWQWCGKVDGKYFAGECWNNGSTNSTKYHLMLVYDGKQVQCYIDSVLVRTLDFDLGGRDVHGLLMASASGGTTGNATVSAVYDNFVTTGLVANAALTLDEVQATVTGIESPLRDAKTVTLPTVAAGFTATLVEVTPSGYVDASGNILKRNTERDVTITAKVRIYDERNEKATTTKSFTFTLLQQYNPTIVQEEFAAGLLKNQIIGGEAVGGIPNPYIDETRLRLPRTEYVWSSPDEDLYCAVLPDGFTAELTSSSEPGVIALDGTVTPPQTETEVRLKLKITDTATKQSKTCTYDVTVPAKSGTAGWDTYKDSKVGIFVHYMNGQFYCDGTQATTANEAASAFSVKDVVKYAVSWNLDYIMLTCWHGDMIPLYPSEVQQKYGLNRYTNKDLIASLLNELDKSNKANGTHIQLYLYTHPGQGTALSPVDQQRVGWGDYDKYNTYLSELYYELVSRYTNRANGKQGLAGLYFDEGSVQGDMDLFIDYPRLRDACKRGNTDLVTIQNVYNGNKYSQDVVNHEAAVVQGTTCAASFMGHKDAERWEAAYDGGYSVTLTDNWYPTAAVAETATTVDIFTCENMFRYAVLTASINELGGGVAWAFGNYAKKNQGDATWETGVTDLMDGFAAYYKKYNEALYQTVPSKAYVTANAYGITSLKRVKLSNDNTWGVATDSKDGKYTYLHVLYAPSGSALDITAADNGQTFASASLVGAEGTVTMYKLSTGGYRLMLPSGVKWDETDTVIRLTAGSDAGLTVINASTVTESFEDQPVIFVKGRAFIQSGTTYAEIAEYLAQDGKYIISFMNAAGTDEFDSTDARWSTAAENGMYVRRISADYSELKDFEILVVADEKEIEVVAEDLTDPAEEQAADGTTEANATGTATPTAQKTTIYDLDLEDDWEIDDLFDDEDDWDSDDEELTDDEEADEDEYEETVVVRKLKRKKKKAEQDNTVRNILIAAGAAVLVLGALVPTVVVLVRKKKKKAE